MYQSWNKDVRGPAKTTKAAMVCLKMNVHSRLSMEYVQKQIVHVVVMPIRSKLKAKSEVQVFPSTTPQPCMKLPFEATGAIFSGVNCILNSWFWARANCLVQLSLCRARVS